jgi:hypothetical protein
MNTPLPPCGCAELRKEDTPIVAWSYPGARHDCAYVAQRNALIPEAEAYADLLLEDAIKSGRYANAHEVAARIAWTRWFSTKMDELARKLT